MNFRRIAIIFGFIAVVALMGFAIWYVFFYQPAPPAEELPPINGAPSGLPTAPVGRPVGVVPTAPPVVTPAPVAAPVADGGLTVVTPVTTVSTIGAAISSSGQLNYYNRDDGRFYRLKDDGTAESLSNKQFFSVQEAKFNPRGDAAILTYPDGAKIYYDFSLARQVTLPRHWEDFDFSTAGDKIVAKSLPIDPAARYLLVANPDGSQARAVQALGDNEDKVTVAWSPNNQIIATSETGSKLGVDRQEIYMLGQNQENFRAITVEGLDFRPMWAPTGQQLLYSVAGSVTDWKPMLWITDAAGDDIGSNRRMLGVYTWADKCAFTDASTLYCAVPNEMPRGAGLQPDVLSTTPDSIYKIDLSTNIRTKIAVPEGDHVVDKLMLTPDGRRLYFTDKDSGILNEIKLAP